MRVLLTLLFKLTVLISKMGWYQVTFQGSESLIHIIDFVTCVFVNSVGHAMIDRLLDVFQIALKPSSIT